VAAAIEEFRAFPTTEGAPPASLRQLHEWLIAPVEPHLRTAVLGVIPHDVLHYLPFAALTNGQTYLGERYTLFALPSASTLAFLRPKSAAGPTTALALGFGQAEGLAPLTQAEQEAQAVADLLQGEALTGAAASETALRARAATASVIHLAAHGQLVPASPLFSRLVLAPDGDHDGALEIQEIYDLGLARAELVVLSACQTQLGAQSRGDDLVGLNRAFIAAGAPSVVGSLWTVDDEATGLLMASFYSHLAHGLPKAEALRAAQAAARTKYPHPYYWAAFVLTGDPGAAPPRPTPVGLALGVLAAGLLAAGIIGAAWRVRPGRRRAA
jgi:CHAT domain-containing protein